MKRGWAATLVAILAALWVFSARIGGDGLLADTDTKVTIAKIRERHDPLSWFAGDWPLENRFYRPVSTLAYEFDNAVYGNNAAGYGFTNALLCVICVLLTFWFIRELTDRPALAAASSLIFASWHVRGTVWIANLVDVVILAVLAGGVLRHGIRIRHYIPAVLVLLAAASQRNLGPSLGTRTIEWVPGRTATVMTVFCLIAMAAYARYERLHSERKAVPPGPLDPPATRNTEARAQTRVPAAVWPVIATISAVLAFGAYEQAVMLPACLLAVACAFHWRGYRVRWGWQAAFWVLLPLYLLLRRAVIPAGVSSYQDQQLRFGPGVLLALNDYLVPSIGVTVQYISGMAPDWLVLLTSSPYSCLLGFARDVAAFVAVRRVWVLAFAFWGMSFFAYLPMAFLQPFEHYHYWPMAIRSGLVAVLGMVGFQMVATAWSRPSTSAPPRPDPAPGSLPRP